MFDSNGVDSIYLLFPVFVLSVNINILSLNDTTLQQLLLLHCYFSGFLKHSNGRSSLVQVSPVFGFKLKPLHTQQRNLFVRLTFYNKDWLWEKGKYELRGLSDWKAFCGTIKTESVSALSICMRSHCQSTRSSSSSTTVTSTTANRTNIFFSPSPTPHHTIFFEGKKILQSLQVWGVNQNCV